MFTIWLQIVILIAWLQRFDTIQLKDGCLFCFHDGGAYQELEHSELQK